MEVLMYVNGRLFDRWVEPEDDALERVADIRTTEYNYDGVVTFETKIDNGSSFVMVEI